MECGIVATSPMLQIDLTRDSMKVKVRGLDSVTSCANFSTALVSGLPSKRGCSLKISNLTFLHLNV